MEAPWKHAEAKSHANYERSESSLSRKNKPEQCIMYMQREPAYIREIAFGFLIT